MRTESYNDDKLFDRLVDGELTQPERRSFLESLDQRPDGWRRCALAFLEAQSLRVELTLLARHSQAGENLPKATHPLAPASKERNVHEPGRATGVQWLAIAAGLVMAFGLGWLGRERGVQFARSGPGGDRQVAQLTPGPVSAASANLGNALTFFVRDNAGKQLPVRVPLVDADTLDRQFGTKFQPTIPDEIRKQLQSQGYTVQSKQQYAPLWTESGRPMFVPVEDTKIIPVNNKVF